MRSRALLLLAAALVLAPPPALAQDLPLPPPAIVEDPVGDLEGFVPAEGAGFVDLVRGEVVPQEAGLGLRATVADLSMDAVSGLQWELWLSFDYRGVPFDLAIFAQTSAPLPQEARWAMWGDPSATLYRMDGDSPVLVEMVPAALDAATATWNTSLPWHILEADGHSPQPGEALRLRGVAALWDATLTGSPHQAFPIRSTGTSVLDTAAFPEGTFLQVPGAVGDLALATPLPVRSSNGEATTFHWPVEVINRGARDLEVALALDPDGADARWPQSLRVPAGANATVNVFVTVPFAHQHGATRSFPLTARSDGGDVAVLRLGVDYPAIAQPAGHHPDLYLHGGVRHLLGNDALPIDSGLPWMNTLEEDPAGTASLIAPREDNCPRGPDVPAPPPVGPFEPPTDFGSFWSIPLQPALAIGLDGRVGEAATLDLELVAEAAMPPGRLYGRLTRTSESFDGFGPFFNRTDPFRAEAGIAALPGPGRVSLHLDLPMPPSLDLVPPSRNENLLLALIVCLDTPVPAGHAPTLANSFAGILAHSAYALGTGGHLRLAVDEYHDVVPTHAPSPGEGQAQPAAQAGGKDAPALPLGLALAALALLALRRRP